MKAVSNQPGVLYVVATPIGNLGDISARALQTLEAVDLIAAEDTRHSRRLLSHFGIHTPLLSLHEHNERERAHGLVERLCQGQSVALVSDAGTPLVSDPGYHLVNAAWEAGARVVPVPGPSAVLAALSVCGLPTDRFVFEGFLPSRGSHRRRHLEALAGEGRTMVFFESARRIADTLEDMGGVFDTGREAVLARELTKRFESVRRGTLGILAGLLRSEEEAARGEFVVVVRGARSGPDALSPVAPDRLLRVLLQEVPLKTAVRLAAQITGESRNSLYRLAVRLSGEGEG